MRSSQEAPSFVILDGSRVAAAGVVAGATDPRGYLLACYPEAAIPPIEHASLTAPPLVAVVNHGTWIAPCSCGARGLPAPGCLVWTDVPWGWCVRCGNRAWGGGWRFVVVPGEDERRLIEAVLEARPNAADRNWEPGESVEMLAAENAAHGDPVPDLAVIRIGPLHGPVLAPPAATFPPPSVMRAVPWRGGEAERLQGRRRATLDAAARPRRTRILGRW